MKSIITYRQYKCGTKVWINKKEFHLSAELKKSKSMIATKNNTKVGKEFWLSKIFFPYFATRDLCYLP
jgi:hypothetical protein